MDKGNSLFGDQPDEGERIPPRQWQPERPFDSADYLEGAPPRYAASPPEDDDLTTSRARTTNASALEEDLPDLRENEFPDFARTAEQRHRWRLVLGITRKITGKDDLKFAYELFVGDLPTDEKPPVPDAADASKGAPAADAPSAPEVLSIPDEILTKRLRAGQVPAIDLATVDFSRPVTLQLNEVWTFALTFDGYRYFGVTDGFDPLGPFSANVERTFKRTGELPHLGEIGMYRACLFVQQRMWCKGWSSSGPQRSDVEYFQRLLEAIRSRLS